MRKFFYILSPALIMVGIYVFTRQTPSSQVQVVAPQVKLASKSKQLFLGKRKIIARAVAPQSQVRTKTPEEKCLDLERSLSDLDFNRPFEEWISLVRIEDLQDCKAENLQDKLKALRTSCFGEKLSAQDCQTNMLFMRAQLRTQGIEDADDQETIADLIIKGFGDRKLNFKKISKLSNKLLDFDPSNQNVQKLYAMSKFMSQIDSKVAMPPGAMEEIYAKLDEEVLEGPDFRPYRVFAESGMDPLRTEDLARDFVADYPDRSASHEVLGWSLWQQGRRAEALKQMQEAVKLNPSDQYLQTMYNQLRDPSARRETYQGRLGIGVQLEDLYN